MVQLPKEIAEESAPEHEEILMFFYNDYQVYRYKKPIGLKDFEQIAALAANYSYLKQYTEHSKVRQNTINRLRQMLNMEFKMCCNECGMAHYQDEISAPER